MIRSCVLPLLCLGVCALPARAVIVALNPTADAFVAPGVSNSLTLNNYGGAGAVVVSAPGLSKGEFQSVLRFDVSSAVASFNAAFGAGGWAIDSISIAFNAHVPNNAIFNGNGAGPGGTNVNFAGQFGIGWMQNDGWTEGTGTPNIPTADGISFSTLAGFLGAADVSLGTFAFNGATSGQQTWALALHPSFTADIAGGGNVSIRLFAADAAVSAVFNSRSVPTTNLRPLLSISAVVVPEPGVAALLAAGIVLATTRHSRRH